MARRARLLSAAGLAGGILLSACTLSAPPPDARPHSRPAGLGATRPPSLPVPASARSAALADYYTRVQADLLARGLLRTDGGGVDTPYDGWVLARNFETLAFHDEYAGGNLGNGRGGPVRLRRWVDPVRVTVDFGASVPQAQRNADRASVASFAARLGRVTGHPVSAGENGNFHVFIVGEDDRAAAVERIATLVPSVAPSSLALIRDIPRSIHCLVIAFSDQNNEHIYRKAVAIIRAEHPDLMRRACVHEELAQGMGIANDSPQARPSIFNDDDEFALLTSHDEMLLRMLYDPRLRPGMSADEARPILRTLAEGLTGGPV